MLCKDIHTLGFRFIVSKITAAKKRYNFYILRVTVFKYLQYVRIEILHAH